jgi:hypothetical protein
LNYWAEEKVPITQRYLWFDGKVSASSLKLVEGGLPKSELPNTEILFAGYAYADLPVGKTFQIIFPKGRPDSGMLWDTKILAVTQQMGTPSDRIPYGWKTICLVQFPQTVPDLIRDLPTVDAWQYNENAVCVCDVPTWEAIKSQAEVSVHGDTI